MLEHEFCLTLHAKLKEKIRGKIFTKVENDTLKVRIDMDELYFETYYDDFANRVVIHGLSSDYIVYEVMEKYHKFLTNRMERYYFRKETVV